MQATVEYTHAPPASPLTQQVNIIKDSLWMREGGGEVGGESKFAKFILGVEIQEETSHWVPVVLTFAP